MEKFMEKQQTIARRVSLNGIALHTGVRATLSLNPAPENTGIIFRRIDLPGKPEVRALAANVVDARRGTTIGNEKCAVYTIEHIMSALHACSVDNCIVDMDGAEPPICDGSSKEFFAMVERAGVIQQDADARIWTPTKPLHYKNGSTQVAIFPDAENLSVSCVTSFKGCPVDPQYFEYILERESYKNEIAPGRTFVDYRDLRALMSYGLCKGGSLDAAAIIHNGAIICKDALRFENEIVRHKILDLLGDIYLCGVRIKGSVIAVKPGHPANVALTKLIIEDIKQNQ